MEDSNLIKFQFLTSDKEKIFIDFNKDDIRENSFLLTLNDLKNDTELPSIPFTKEEFEVYKNYKNNLLLIIKINDFFCIRPRINNTCGKICRDRINKFYAWGYDSSLVDCSGCNSTFNVLNSILDEYNENELANQGIIKLRPKVCSNAPFHVRADYVHNNDHNDNRKMVMCKNCNFVTRM